MPEPIKSAASLASHAVLMHDVEREAQIVENRRIAKQSRNLRNLRMSGTVLPGDRNGGGLRKSRKITDRLERHASDHTVALSDVRVTTEDGSLRRVVPALGALRGSSNPATVASIARLKRARGGK